MAATESISEMQTQTIKEFIGKWPKADRFIGVVKKTLRYSNVFFYNPLCRNSVTRNILMESGEKLNFIF